MKTSQVKVEIQSGSTSEETSKTNVDDSKAKKRKVQTENNLKGEFDLSARKYLDWIDNIERILDEKPSQSSESSKRQEIIQVNIILFLHISSIEYFPGNQK